MKPSVRILALVGVLAMVGTSCSAAESGEPPSTAPILSTTTTQITTTEPPTTTTPATEPPTTTQPPSTTTSTLVPLDELQLEAQDVASGFDAPVLLIADPDGGQDVVVEQPGRILRRDSKDVVLDINGDVIYGGERGLLGLAYHPGFSSNRLAYVNYTGEGNATIIEQFTVRQDGTFDVGSRLEILRVRQPARNHNGGMIAFGPDGYLWIGMGDGGGSNDRFRQGQRSDTLLGAMLRIAVGVPGVDTYAIPPDNPFADGVDGAPEVYWTGLRNPWRFAFDGTEVWIGDVGQNAIEEINAVSAGDAALNFGWPVMEGSQCFQSPSCDTSPFVAPVDEYRHSAGCSVTGGYVYRGGAIPELDGHYFYSDFCSGFLASYTDANGTIDWTERVGRLGNVASFGIGGDGELYIVDRAGSISKLARSS